MELEQQLENARNKLAKIKEGREIDLQKYKAELAQREQQRERADTLEAFRNFVSSYEINSTRDIKAREAEVAAMEAEIASPEYQDLKRSRVDLESLKESARASWLQGGGVPDEFDGAWGKLKFSILEQKVLKELPVTTVTDEQEKHEQSSSKSRKMPVKTD